MTHIHSAMPQWAVAVLRQSLAAAAGLSLALSSALAQAQPISRSVAYTYDPNNGQVLTETVDPGGTHCAKTTFTYDGQGNKKSVLVQYCGNSTDPAVAFADRLTLNDFTKHASVGALPTVADGTFLTKVQTGVPNAGKDGFQPELSQTTASYHPAYGVPLTQTVVALDSSVYNIVSKTELDALGRVSRVFTPVGRNGDNTLTFTSTEQKRVYCTGPLAATGAELAACLKHTHTVEVAVASKMLFTSDGEPTSTTTATAVSAYYIETVPKDSTGNIIGARSRVHYDALHREIAKESEAYDKQWTMSLTVYDRLGQAASSWSGFYGRNAAGQFQAPPAELRQWAAKRDLVHRPTESRQFFRAGAGEAAKELAGTTEYMGLSSKSTTPGPNGEWRTSIAHKYGNGQIAQTVDAYGATLNNAYDAVGNLVQTLDPLGNTSTITYTPGTARFKVAMKDPNQGQWQYTYNALGELVKQKDGKGQETTLEYDRIGRLIKKKNPTQNGEWYYNRDKAGLLCAKGLPKLCQTIAGNTSTSKEITSQTLAYDTLGRGTKATVNLADRTWVSESTYDTLGRLATKNTPPALPWAMAIAHPPAAACPACWSGCLTAPRSVPPRATSGA
ncbi:RHS repeat domain-containing protein [Ideonella paludis]|uniref:hypothetical protein n=1 Tax=Ideonella paludis TaxID=1233411 RepID=UPI00362AF8DF